MTIGNNLQQVLKKRGHLAGSSIVSGTDASQSELLLPSGIASQTNHNKKYAKLASIYQNIRHRNKVQAKLHLDRKYNTQSTELD